jgi:hypothetical protein
MTDPVMIDRGFTVYVCASLAPEWLKVFFSYSVFKSLSLTGQCLVNMDIPAPKTEALQMSPKTQISDFHKRGRNSFD